jgi:hypothetical protein
MSASAHIKRFLLIPLPIAALCAFSNMLSGIPRASLPPAFYEWWLVAAPAFVIFRQLYFLLDWLPYRIQAAIGSPLLAICFLFWTALILLPFWRPFRLLKLSIAVTRLAFISVGALLAFWMWWVYYGGPNACCRGE